MRALAILPLLLVAGCGSPQGEPGDGRPVAPAQAVSFERFDRLTSALAPASEGWQDFAAIVDEVAVGNGSVQFQTGLGLTCVGNADGAAAPGSTGVVLCSARLAGRPDTEAMDVHELGIGHDAQRVTMRQPGEPVEWRLQVVLADGATPFDSGWRTVDLTPRVLDPLVTLAVQDPCDTFDEREGAGQPVGVPRGSATLTIESTAAHGRPVIQVDLARSRPGHADSTPFAGHATGEDGFSAAYGTFGNERLFRLELDVDLEAPEPPEGAAPSQACSGAVGGELQEWTIDVGVTGPDGAVEFKRRTVQVDVGFVPA